MINTVGNGAECAWTHLQHTGKCGRLSEGVGHQREIVVFVAAAVGVVSARNVRAHRGRVEFEEAEKTATSGVAT